MFDFTEPSATLDGVSPPPSARKRYAEVSASISIESPMSVPVPCAST